MSKQIVLITSAIYTNYGIYSAEDRFKQTLATAKSAREHIPDSVIYLIDNSKVDIQEDESQAFDDLLDAVDHYFDNSDDPDIQFFHNNVRNYDIGKNSMEVLGFLKFLQYAQSDEETKELFKDANRIFKLSGRYELTDQFDLSKFDNEETKGKYVFKKAQPAWCDQNVTGTDHLLQTRLWSFTPDLLDETANTFRKIIDTMFAIYNRDQYIDVEHSLHKFLDHDKLVQLDTVGLKGNIAPNGMLVID